MPSTLDGMKTNDPRKEIVLERREARARRSKKLGRLFFYCFIVGTTATLRLNPELATELAAQISGAPSEQSEQSEQRVAAVRPTSNMPKDRVKVRRGIGQTVPQGAQDSQALAQDVEQMLSKMTAGQ
jgi:hypothetical protein